MKNKQPSYSHQIIMEKESFAHLILMAAEKLAKTNGLLTRKIVVENVGRPRIHISPVERWKGNFHFWKKEISCKISILFNCSKWHQVGGGFRKMFRTKSTIFRTLDLWATDCHVIPRRYDQRDHWNVHLYDPTMPKRSKKGKNPAWYTPIQGVEQVHPATWASWTPSSLLGFHCLRAKKRLLFRVSHLLS